MVRPGKQGHRRLIEERTNAPEAWDVPAMEQVVITIPSKVPQLTLF
ncbi:MAG: hypothetical protein ACREEJ_08375 [Ensifer adhaerens]